MGTYNSWIIIILAWLKVQSPFNSRCQSSKLPRRLNERGKNGEQRGNHSLPCSILKIFSISPQGIQTTIRNIISTPSNEGQNSERGADISHWLLRMETQSSSWTVFWMQLWISNLTWFCIHWCCRLNWKHNCHWCICTLHLQNEDMSFSCHQIALKNNLTRGFILFWKFCCSLWYPKAPLNQLTEVIKHEPKNQIYNHV